MPRSTRTRGADAAPTATLGGEADGIGAAFAPAAHAGEAPRSGDLPDDASRHASLQSFEPLLHEWDELADRMAAMPCLRPGWSAAWWRAFGTGRLEIRTLRRNGRLVAVLPMARRHHALRSASNCHTPRFGLLALDWDAEAALARALFAGRPRRVSIASLDPAGPSMQACRRAAEEAGYKVAIRPHQHSPYLDIAGDWAGYESRLSRNLLRDLRRSWRRLGRHGKLSFEIADGRAHVREPLTEAFAVEAAGWKGIRRTAIQSSAPTRSFYTELARWAAARGMLRIFFLRLDRRPLAMYYALMDRGRCHLLKGGYDPDYKRFSPGKLLMRGVISHCFSMAVSRVEFHGDAEPYKLLWAGAVQTCVRFEAFPPTPAGRLAWAALTYGRPVARRLLAGLGAWKGGWR